MHNILPVHETISFILKLYQRTDNFDIFEVFLNHINKYLPSISFSVVKLKPEGKSYIELTSPSFHFGYVLLDGDLTQIPSETFFMLKSFLDLLGIMAENKNHQQKLYSNNLKLAELLKQNTEKLSKVEFKYKDLADSINEIFFMFNSEFKIVHWNKSAADFFEISAEEAINKELWDILPQFKNTEFGNMVFASTISLRHETFNLNFKRNNKNYVLLVNLYPDDSASCSVLIHDITEKFQEEKKHEEFYSKLQNSQKLESLGILAGGIAHDFNNLLMGILGNVSLALLDTDSSNPIKSNLLEIENAAKKSAKLAQKLLQYAGRGVLQTKKIDISVFTEEIADMLKSSIPNEITIKFDFADYPLPVECDVAQITQIIMNFIINASDAMNGNGEIIIHTGLEYYDKHQYDFLEKHVIEPGDYVYIEIEDHGSGIEKENLKRIFEPFFTTKFTGRGLGLSAAMGIARQHGGTIVVFSEPGKGSKFRLLLPSISDSFVSEKDTSKVTAIWSEEKTVLFIDAEETVRTVGTRLLKRIGFNVLSAANGEEAIQIAEKHPDNIDIAIIDKQMPGIDYEKTLISIKQHCPKIKAIMSTSYTENESLYELQQKGFYSYIQKPYDFKELSHMMRMLVLAPEETLQNF